MTETIVDGKKLQKRLCMVIRLESVINMIRWGLWRTLIGIFPVVSDVSDDHMQVIMDATPQGYIAPADNSSGALHVELGMKICLNHNLSYRVITRIRLVYFCAHRGHPEQPASAMSWEEPIVQKYLVECNCTCYW